MLSCFYSGTPAYLNWISCEREAWQAHERRNLRYPLTDVKGRRMIGQIPRRLRSSKAGGESRLCLTGPTTGDFNHDRIYYLSLQDS